MWQPDRINLKDKRVLLIAYLNFLPVIKPWRETWVFVFALLIVFQLPATACAEENYYQIINGTQPTVNDDFIKDRGYSVFVNFDGQKFLYDVGLKKKSFLGNMEAAGIGLAELDFVALSHRHSDHTRGWSFLRKAQPSLPIYVAVGSGLVHIPDAKEVTDYIQISPNIFIIHTHDDAGTTEVTDELSIVIRTKKGPYLFTTNSHTDFFIKVEKAKLLTGQDVYFHSGHTLQRFVPDSIILEHANKMKVMNIKQVSPSHSSPRHNEVFKQVFGSGYVPAVVGKKVPLEPVSR